MPSEDSITPNSITQWIAGLKSGTPDSAEAIWNQYFSALTALAMKRLQNAPRRVADEEDVALSALQALCAGAKDDRFRKLENRDDLWQILVMITTRKAALIHRKHARRNERGESAILGQSGDAPQRLEELLAATPSEDSLTSLDLTSSALLGCLDEKLRKVAVLKLAGHTNREIADKINRSVKTIERYLNLIRVKWNNRVDL